MVESCLIFSIAALLFTAIQFVKYLEEKKMNEERIRLMNTNIQFDLAEIVATFETFIDLTMGRYLSLNRDFWGEDYINSDEEEALLREISKEVMNLISPYMINKLSLVYNIVDEKDLADLITKTVYLKLLDYITDHNSIKNNR